MVAADYGAVVELNLRARADLVAAGEVDQHGVGIAGGGIVGVGDHVVTRQNDRRLSAGGGWVKNGDTWTVKAIGRDGSISVHRYSDGAEVVLPDGYARTHVELDYAATTYRAQGRTVDTAHAFVGPSTTRELLYVAATRGRKANTLYVDTCSDPDIDTNHDSDPSESADELLARALERTDSEMAAYAVLESKRELLATRREQGAPSGAGFDTSERVTDRPVHAPLPTQSIGLI